MGASTHHAPKWLQSPFERTRTWSYDIWISLGKNNLWRRMVKFSLATMISVIITLIPAVNVYFPQTAFLAPLSTVFAHAGQRVGLMIEGLGMMLAGSATGTAWASLGLWLSSYVVDQNEEASYAIRAMFMLISVFHFGYLRSSSPRLIVYCLFHLSPSVVLLVGPDTDLSGRLIASIAYPLLIGAASVVVCNLAIFPELSCDYLAQTTVSAITETTTVLTRTTAWFLQFDEMRLGLHDGLEIIPSAHPVSEIVGTGKMADKPRVMQTDPWYQRLLPGFRKPVHADRRQAILRPAPTETTSLASLTESKTSLRSALQRCKAGQSEANMEVSVGALPPNSLKPISTNIMRGLIHNAITLIGSCENKFVLIGDEPESDEGSGVGAAGSPRPASSPGPRKSQDSLSGDPKKSSTSLLLDPLKQLELVKPSREVEAGDPEVLEAIVGRIREPVQELMKSIKQTSRSVTRSLSYCYGLKRLPSGARTPIDISLNEMDYRIDSFMEAIQKFDHSSVEELVRATSTSTGEMDIMPKMETFLVSSFLLGLRQAAVHMLQMLQHSRSLVEQRQAKRFSVSLHVPGTTGWRAWLSTGGEKDAMVLPKMARKKGRTGHDSTAEKQEAREQLETSSIELEKPLTRQTLDEEHAMPEALTRRETVNRAVEDDEKKQARKKQKERQKRKEKGLLLPMRHWAANLYESLQKSDDAIYATKLVVAFFAISWPGFVPAWRSWYSANRGLWAPLQLILIFEVAIGTSLFVFVIRLVGVIFGCLVGFLSVEIGRGNKIVMVVVLLIGIWPSVYLQLGTKYVKTGMVALTSMTAVALTAIHTGTPAHENFYLRILTFFIGSTAGLIVELVLYPSRARDRMVEALSSCIKQMTEMQTAIALGVDNPSAMDLRSLKVQHRFERSRAKAVAALTAADTFLPFCLTEPRLKGSFRPLHPIYREIIYVLHQIVDRMDNMLQLRRAYGNAVLEELNPEVHAYRRAVAAAIAVSLFAVNEALTIRMPLPQFLPSARVAKLRLINRVREVLEERAEKQAPGEHDVLYGTPDVVTRDFGLGDDPMDERTTRVANLHKVLSWNANSAGLMEIIEYLEELVELAKLLVGVNAFRSGLLERPTFKEYAKRTQSRDQQPLALGALGDAGDAPRKDEGLRRAVTEAMGQDAELTRCDTRVRRRGTAAPGDQGSAADMHRHDSRRSGEQAAAGDEEAIDLREMSSRGSSSGHKRADSRAAADAEEADIPISLRRVSSRRASVRRRRPTNIGGSRPAKGKGIDEEDEG